jgi:hypothetical protein
MPGEWFNFKYIKKSLILDYQLDYEDICTMIFENNAFIINCGLLKLKKWI